MPRFPRLSPSVDSLSDRVYSDLVERARARGLRPCPLHVGDTYLDPPPVARAEAQRSEDHARLHNYAPVQGEPVLLEAVARRLARRAGYVTPTERIQVMAGATAGLNVVCQALLAPGDEVLLPSPFWPLIRGIVASRGAVPVQIPWWDRLDAPGFDPEAALEARITPRTVALYLNSPSNPTGRILPPAAVDAAIRVAVRHDLWVICDEAYEELYYGAAPPAPLWAHPALRERAVACHTLSKAYGLAGARVGYAHGPEALMQAVRGAQTFLTYCAPRPMQLGAARALDEADDFLAHCREVYGAAGRAAAEALGVRHPEGGTFLFVDASPWLPADATTSAPFLERCLEAEVLLTPGSACGEAYPRWVRLCFTAVPPGELERALDRLAPLLRS